MQRRLVAMSVVAALVWACDSKDAEVRARETAEKIKASIPDVQARALAQVVEPAAVKAAQEQLTALKEYQGEINGTLDAVTVNAIQAFQNANNLRPDGLLSEKVRNLLRDAVAKQAKS